jgi:hypothetical protein
MYTDIEITWRSWRTRSDGRGHARVKISQYIFKKKAVNKTSAVAGPMGGSESHALSRMPDDTL